MDLLFLFGYLTGGKNDGQVTAPCLALFSQPKITVGTVVLGTHSSELFKNFKFASQIRKCFRHQLYRTLLVLEFKRYHEHHQPFVAYLKGDRGVRKKAAI